MQLQPSFVGHDTKLRVIYAILLQFQIQMNRHLHSAGSDMWQQEVLFNFEIQNKENYGYYENLLFLVYLLVRLRLFSKYVQNNKIENT